jgi:hypothetical protein
MSTSGQTPPISISGSPIDPVSLDVSTIRWDAQRERIYSWLGDQGGPGFAQAFKGAALLMHLKPPAYVRFVCHALRDITNGLPAVIAKKERKQVQYHQLMDQILAQWKTERLPRGPIATTNVALDQQDSGRFEEVTISAALVEKLATLLNEHEQGRARGKENPLSFLESSIPEIAGRTDLLEIPRAQWKALQADAQQDAHENGKGSSAEDEAACANLFARFESLLASLAGSYYVSLENIDAILEEANS